jgi:exopolyphosphatase/guanosine-5'-triphosphate,3'-diphosphate pyrophosphatase
MYGVIDIGSNTMRLSVYKKGSQDLTLLFNKKNAAGLAAYVDSEGCLSSEGIERAVEVLTVFSRLIENIGLKEVYAFATASLRNVANSEAAAREISARTGFEIQVLSGEEEGLFDFIGATRYMRLRRGLMVDIGGGSTELVSYSEGNARRALSLPIGSLNLYLKHVSDILPTTTEIQEMRVRVRAELDEIRFSQRHAVICGVGGTARNLCKLNNHAYRMDRGNRSVDTIRLRKMLAAFGEDRVLAKNKILQVAPDRIHTMIPGMVLLDEIAQRIGAGVIEVSEKGLREGYLFTKIFGGGA